MRPGCSLTQRAGAVRPRDKAARRHDHYLARSYFDWWRRGANQAPTPELGLLASAP